MASSPGGSVGKEGGFSPRDLWFESHLGLAFLDDMKYLRCDINNLLMSHPVGAM